MGQEAGEDALDEVSPQQEVGTSWNQHEGVYHQRGPGFLRSPDFSLGIFASQAWPQLFLVGSHPWCDGAARKWEWGLCPGAWNLVAAIPP